MTDLTARLREDLAAALRERDRETVRVLRTVLSAIANAEAQPVESASPSWVTDGAVAGASAGVGATEVARRELDDNEVLAVVRAERDERVTTADVLAEGGASEAAATLMAEASLLGRYLV